MSGQHIRKEFNICLKGNKHAKSILMSEKYANHDFVTTFI